MHITPGKSRAPQDTKPNTPVSNEIASEALFNGRRIVVIQHGEDHYRLQITGAGKLILTK